MTKKVVAITQSNYIPWKGYFQMMRKADVFVLYDTAQYTRRDWRNRNQIKTMNGRAWLTIPVKVKGNYYQPIAETRVSDPRWAEKHWKTLKQTYGKAPYFSESEAFFEELYLGCESEYLSEINYRFLSGICDLLEIETEFRWSRDFDLSGDKNERLINICRDLNATDYITGPAARAYMDESLFEEVQINVDWMDYSRYPEYSQINGPFVHAVSILDLIFNTGPKALEYMLAKV
ncbi:MAG: WbqC family protein [Roseivirga sp.]|nr:WbqC family protein [Roseivirga sp.]